MSQNGGTVIIPILPQAGRAGRPGAVRGEREVPTIEDAFHDLLHHSGLAVYVCDLAGNRLFINEAFRDIYNALAEQPVKGSTDALPLPPALAQTAADVSRAKARVVRAETVMIGGSPRHYRAHHFPIFHGGVLAAVGGIFYDISQAASGLIEAREARARLDDVIRSTSDWVWETDAEGRITFVSERITEILGRLPAALVGRSLLDFGRLVGEGPSAADPFREAKPFRNRLVEMRDHAGAVRQIHLSGVPVFEPRSGRLAGFRGTGTDITAQRRAEEEALRSRRALEHTLEQIRNKNVQLESALEQVLVATRAKGEFLATMSHELRTPLNAIIGFAEVIMLNTFGEMPAKYKSYVNEIINAGRHLLSKINDILDVARAENRTLAVETLPCSLADIVNRALANVVLRAQEKHIDFSRVQLSRDVTVKADPERARQIFENLLSNAVKFTPAGGTVGLELRGPAEGTVAATVWDTGIGIAPDKQEAIFESFQQIHDGIFSRGQDGTGLGLTVARHVARLMGGDITVESAPGQGSRFTVTLPVASEGNP